MPNDTEVHALLLAQMAWGGAIGPDDYGALFPASDARDLAAGAPYVPGDVTMARRRGTVVEFNPSSCVWTFPDGTTRI
jgi:hypothetical protein